MKHISLPVLAAGVGLAVAGLALPSAANAAVVIDGLSLDYGVFGAQTGVHSDEGQTGASVSGYINQDGSDVTFSTTSGSLNLAVNGQGQATISGDPGIENLRVVFEKAWDKITFSFDGENKGLFDLTVNATTLFSGGGNCSVCKLKNGETKFVLSGEGITQLDFTFTPALNTAKQFRVLDPDSINAVPEPASWALMMSGLGLLGFAMRRRPATRAVSFS